MKRFTYVKTSMGCNVFRQSDDGAWCKAEEALMLECRLARYARSGIFLRLWVWLFGMRV
jgi:hypothetical protein